MKGIYGSVTILLLGLVSFLNVQAKDLLYYVDVCTFYSGEGKPYIEIYLQVEAASLDYVSDENGTFDGAVAVGIKVENTANNEKVFENAFQLINPDIADSSAQALAYGLLDLKRVSLNPGKYSITGTLKDLKNPDAKEHKFVYEIEVKPQPSMISSISDIEFIQSFRSAAAGNTSSSPVMKHGFEIMPQVSNNNFYNQDSLKFYFETYNVNKESPEVYFINSYITQANSDEKMGKYQKVIRHNSKSLDIVNGSFNISELPTQAYYLNIDIYNTEQKLIANTQKKFFVINKNIAIEMTGENEDFASHFKMTEADLDYYIPTLQYISTNTERDFAGALTTLEQKQAYFYNFWNKRKSSPDESPEKGWVAYKSRVDYANKTFKEAHLAGWRTDRGRVMLTYGAPNDVERFPSSNNVYPYHVWRYNKLKTQSNVKFIFFNQNEATGDYTLLHSDLRGERANPRWEYDLRRRTMQDGNLDKDKVNDDGWN